MQWRPAYGFDDYEVSEAGDVRRTVRGGKRYQAGYILKPKRHKRGYLCYTLKCGLEDKTVLAHRLVAFTFLGEPPSANYEVAHNDGTRTNNHFSNLRWATPTENQADRKKHGTFHEGSVCPSSKLTEANIALIRECYSAGGRRYAGGSVTMDQLATQFGVSLAQISRIVNGKHWNSVAPS